MHFNIVILVFAVIFMAELPDKTVFASLLLGRRFRGWYVWLGAAAAFLVQVIIAVTAGKLLTLLPHRLLVALVGLVFLASALLLFFGKQRVEDVPLPHQTHSAAGPDRFGKIFMTSFAIVFLGELGDITQLATANYAARYHDPWSVGIGAVLALWTVTGLAITVGVKALSVVPTKSLQRVTAAVLLLFALLSFDAVIR